ncbi:MAG: hypothetical protein V1709_07135 [Planctomycetota bacterium]
MKKLIILVVSLALVAASVPVLATGNGAPSGAHYNLNIIGVTNDKNVNMDSGSGNVIFVDLSGRTRINLQEGDFAVIDKNGTDGVAAFQLPKPGIDPYLINDPSTQTDTVTDYSVFVRPLGKPGGWATIRTCADLVKLGVLSGKLGKTLIGNDAAVCSLEQVGSPITLRTKGKSTFTNVTAELLTIVFAVNIDTDGDGVADISDYARVPIFDESLEGEYWEYDNNGLKLLQVRFYPGVPTDVTDSDDDFLF